MSTSKQYSGPDNFILTRKELATELITTQIGDILVHTQKCPTKQTENQDAAGVLFQEKNNQGILAVADGMGGAPLGDKAAELVINNIFSEICNSAEYKADFRNQILDGIENANRQIIDLKVGAGSTCALIEINNHSIRPCHVGDSSIVVVGQRGKIKFQSIAHSPVGYALEAGHLDEEEALQHTDLNEISNYVGFSEMRIDIGPSILLDRYDTVILGSDGLFDNLRLEEIISIIRKDSLTLCAEELIKLLNARMEDTTDENPSKPDDVVFILYRRNC